jgi:hypothetical protein
MVILLDGEENMPTATHSKATNHDGKTEKIPSYTFKTLSLLIIILTDEQKGRLCCTILPIRSALGRFLFTILVSFIPT